MLVVSCQNWCMRAVCRALGAVMVASCWIVCTRSLFLFSDCCNCPAFFGFFFTRWRLFCCYLKVCLPRISKLHFISVAITCTNNLIYCKCTELQCPEAYLKLACFSVLKNDFYIFFLIYFKQTVCSHFHSTWHHGHFGENLNCLQMKCGHYFYIAMTNVNTSESENVLWVKLNRFFISNVVLMYLGCPESYF